MEMKKRVGNPLKMKEEYDFSKMKSRKNPYASSLKKSVTMRLGEDVIDYFKNFWSEKVDSNYCQV